MLKAKIHAMELEEEEEVGAIHREGHLWDELGVTQVLDGSGIDGQVGVAAALLRCGKESRVLRFHLGTTTDHMVYKAELVGLLLVLHLLHKEREVN